MRSRTLARRLDRLAGAAGPPPEVWDLSSLSLAELKRAEELMLLAERTAAEDAELIEIFAECPRNQAGPALPRAGDLLLDAADMAL